MVKFVSNWKQGIFTKEKYDTWRYNYPKFDTTQKWAKVPSQGLSDFLLDGLKKDDE